MRKYNHIGIVTKEAKEGASFKDGLNVWLTDFSQSPNKIEWLKFVEGSCMHELIQKETHIAYEVSNLEEELKNANLLFGPAAVNEHLTIAFVEEEGIPIELMEFK